MSEEVPLLAVSKDNSLVQQTSIKSKNSETQKPKRKQEYTDIINLLLRQQQQPTSTTSKK